MKFVSKLTANCFNTVNGKYCCNDSKESEASMYYADRFNTVNGKYCCNAKKTAELMEAFFMFQYRKR